MGTPEQRCVWREWLRTITTAAFVVIFGLLLGNMNNNIMKLKIEQERTQKLLEIDVKSTDYALTNMFDGEYRDFKKDKKAELLKDYDFKKGDK